MAAAPSASDRARCRPRYEFTAHQTEMVDGAAPAPRDRRCRSASKHSTAQATPTLRDSARPSIGMATAPPMAWQHLGPEAGRLVPQEQGGGHRPVERRIVVAVPDHGGQGPIAPPRQRGGEGNRVGLHAEGDVEQRPGGRPHRLGVVRIDGLAAEDDRVDPGGIGGPQHRPGVAGIAHVDQDDDQGLLGRRPCQPGHVAPPASQHGQDRQNGLWRDRVGHPLEHARSEREEPRPRLRAPAHTSRGSAGSSSPSGARYTDSIAAPARSAVRRSSAPSATKTRSAQRVERFCSRLRTRRTRRCVNASGWLRRKRPRRFPWPGSRQRILGGPDQRTERVGVGHRQIGQHLAVDLDAGQVQPVDQAAVAQAVEASPGVDALDPQLAEVPLAGAAVPEGVLHRVHELLVGRPVGTALVAVVPLRLFQNGAVVLATMDGSLDSGHRGSSSLLVGSCSWPGSSGRAGTSDAEHPPHGSFRPTWTRRPHGPGGGCAHCSWSRSCGPGRPGHGAAGRSR